MVMGGRPWKSSARPAQDLETGENAKAAIEPAAIGNGVKMAAQDKRPIRLAAQRRPGIPAASRWCSTGSPASLLWNHARALSQVGVQAILCAP